MPLDEFQKSVLQVLMPLRTPQSVFAGGSVLQRHGHRLSNDQDVFHGQAIDVGETADRDCLALREAGMNVDFEARHEGLVEALVSHEEFGFTKIQWVASGAWNFFQPVPDPIFGYRLHMADICINKALAAGGRRVVRDYVDLDLIHAHVMPLWLAVWAAPGKDESWTPVKLLEKIAATNQFRQADLDEEVTSTVDLTMGEIGARIRDAIEEAREIFKHLPGQTAGCLFVDTNGRPVKDIARILAKGTDVTTIEVAAGGIWPSGPDIDATLIESLIETYGWDGQADQPTPRV